MMQKQKALLVGVNINNRSRSTDLLEELKSLTIACELEVAAVVEQNLKSVNTSYYIGLGKVEEIKLIVDEIKADVIIFNTELSPVQLRNLEEELKQEIIDRIMLILRIFAKRAKTREAKLQVEVARLKYMLPRLVGSNENLSRQGGGTGLNNKGSGETKLELDRRKIETKISELSKELDTLVEERNIQRSRRSKAGLPTVSLVGYTNAGKSTLMNAMVDRYKKDSSKKVFEKDMLFATLETSVRNITLPNRKAFLLADTVGFISNLPHGLIKAFRSTLEEVRRADLLLHVVDCSDSEYLKQMEVTGNTLEEIGADKIPMLTVFNKADLTERTVPYVRDEEVYISAKNKLGIEELVQLISKRIFVRYVECDMLIPYDQGRIVAYLNENASVRAIKYVSEGTYLSVECRECDYQRYEEYVRALPTPDPT